MRFLRTSAVLILSCGTLAAFGQNTSAPTSSGTTSSKAPVDLSGFKEHIEEKNKVLNDQVSSTKAIVKKNTAILQDAKRIDQDNKRLAAERKALEAQNAEFARESQAMQSETTGVSVPTPPPAAPVRVVPVAPVAPAKVEVAAPAPIETVAAPRVTNTPPAARVETVSASERDASIATVVSQPVAQAAPPAEPDAIIVRTPDTGLSIAENAPIARPSVTEGRSAALVAADPSPVRVSSGVSQGMLLTPIVPVYPSIAVSAHVEGAVVMEAIISRDGRIANVHAVSGPMLLREAALDAVKVARYRPYTVNGQSTEVVAMIKVVFQISR